MTGRLAGLSPVTKALTGLLVCCAVLALGASAVLVVSIGRLEGQLDRIPNVFPAEEGRPPAATTPEDQRPLNILLLGTDRRPDQAVPEPDAWIPGLQRSDTMMLLHIDADRRGASLISIPRDAWVPIPGNGPNKINAAFSFAGPALAVQTIEQLTDVRIDHLMVVDWDGFARLTDVLGGVTVTIEETVHDSYRDVTWTAGEHHLDGEEALDYVGQRAGLTHGDLTRVQRQQNFLRSMITGMMDTAEGLNPRRIYSALDALTENTAVDDEWRTSDMRSLALSLRRLRPSDVDFLTVPVAGLGREGAQSVVYLDHDRGRSLWKALRRDDVASWLIDNRGVETPAAVD